jgi:thiol:disulfide interchange protein
LEDREHRPDGERSFFGELLSGWVLMYVVGPLIVAVVAVICLLLIQLGLPYWLALTLAAIGVGVPLLAVADTDAHGAPGLRAVPYFAGIALVLAGTGWLLLLVVGSHWTADTRTPGALVAGLIPLVAGAILLRVSGKRRPAR